MKPGDIVLIRFPQTDLQVGKLHPATGLKAHSAVRLSRLATVETSVINAKLGEISVERLSEAKKTRDWLAARIAALCSAVLQEAAWSPQI